MQQHETAIRNDIMVRLATLTHKGQRACIVWRRFVGRARAFQDSSVVMTIGTPGMADIGGFLCTGRALEVEVKTESGRLRPEQENWRKVCLAMGALYILARSADEAERAVVDALAS